MSSPIFIRVVGTPKAQPRARAFARNGHARMYDPSTAEGWKAQVVKAVREKIPDTTFIWTVRISILFLMPRPKSHFRSGKHSHELKPMAPKLFCSKPDRDNLDKAVLDALTAALILEDDSLVVCGEIAKVYAPPNVSPGAVIAIRDATGDDYESLLSTFRVFGEWK